MSETPGQRCGACKETKPLTDFAPSYRGKPGTWCRPCFAAYHVGERVSVPHQPLTCSQCGQSYIPKNMRPSANCFCSRKCKERARNAASRRALAERKAAMPPRFCPHCGKQLPSSMNVKAIFCSALCNDHAHSTQRWLRAAGGRGGEPGYLRAEVCARDKWMCQICREPVDPDSKWPDSASSSLDHVIPRSELPAGDEQHWHPRNLRLTHLGCNASRRNKGGNEQLALC